MPCRNPQSVAFASSTTPKVSVVVPTLNERAAVGELLPRLVSALRALGEPFEILVVDDSSPDGTAAEVRRVAQEIGESEKVFVIDRKGNPSLSAAVVEGFAHARGEFLVVMDADLSHPPEAVRGLLAPLLCGRSQIAVGSRYVPGGGVKNWRLPRRLVSCITCALARPLVQVKDATSGFFALRRDVIDGTVLAPLGFKICLEILVKARPRNVDEVPYVFQGRSVGKSKVRLCTVWLTLRHLAALYRHKLLGVT